MVEVAKIAMKTDCKFLILRDFIYKEINWDILDPQSGENTWILRFLKYVQENLFCHHVSKVTRVRGADVSSELNSISTHGSIEIRKHYQCTSSYEK